MAEIDPQKRQRTPIDWSRIDTVLLDMDGTLLDLCYDNFFWNQHLPSVYAKHKQLSPEAASARFQALSQHYRGKLHWYCLDHWSRELELDVAALKRELRHMIAARPYAVEFLQRLRGIGRNLVMVTNAHPGTLALKMECVDLRCWFDRVVVSHDLDVPKEEIVFWEKLQALHPFEPSRTLLIDDTEAVLESARSYGIAHLLTLLQPDSSQEIRAHTQFSGIHHFDEIMPEAPFL